MNSTIPVAGPRPLCHNFQSARQAPAVSEPAPPGLKHPILLARVFVCESATAEAPGQPYRPHPSVRRRLLLCLDLPLPAFGGTGRSAARILKGFIQHPHPPQRRGHLQYHHHYRHRHRPRSAAQSFLNPHTHLHAPQFLP